MKAIVAHQFGPIEDLRIEDRPDPIPRSGEILIDVAAAAVNFPDQLVISGRYQVKPPLPFVPGKELAGVVAAVGPGVFDYAVGDRVMAMTEYGAFCERIAIPTYLCHRIPDSMQLDDAAAIGIAYQTAHFSLHHRGKLCSGENVLITAANGSIGLSSIQLAKAAGAIVGAVVADDTKHQIVLDNGADYAITYDSRQSDDQFRATVYQHSAARGVDLLIDSAGGAIFSRCLRTVAWEGRAVIVGFTTGEIPKIGANYLLVKNISAIGLQWSDYRDREPAMVKRVQTQIFDLFRERKLKSQIMARFPLTAFRDAFELLSSRKIRGKIILIMGAANR